MTVTSHRCEESGSLLKIEVDIKRGLYLDGLESTMHGVYRHCLTALTAAALNAESPLTTSRSLSSPWACLSDDGC
jgi:hypothetical protein